MMKSKLPSFDVFNSAWLSGVSEESLTELKQLAEKVRFEDKATIYALGGPQNALWGVISGQVQVRVALVEMEPVLGHIHQPGAWFGESELLMGLDGLVEMKAVGPTIVAKVWYSQFRKIANEFPDLWEALARLTSMNQLLAMSAANDLVMRNSKSRIAAALLRLSGRRSVLQGSRHADIVHASQQEIAELSNISLSKASVLFGELVEMGLIRQEYGRIVLVNPDDLLDLIE